MSSWSCFNCTFENAPDMPMCELCGTVKESTWWKCADCDFARNHPSSDRCLGSGCGKRRVAEFISWKHEKKVAPAPARPEIKVQEVEDYVCPVPTGILPDIVRVHLIGRKCTCKGCLRNREVLAKFAREFIGDIRTAHADHIGKPGTFFRCVAMKAPEFIDIETLKRLNRDYGNDERRISLMADRMLRPSTKTKMIFNQRDSSYKITCPSCECEHDLRSAELNCRVLRCGDIPDQHIKFTELTKVIKAGNLAYNNGCLRGIAFVKEGGDYFAYTTDLNDFIIP